MTGLSTAEMAVSVGDTECYCGVTNRLRALGGLDIRYTVFAQTTAAPVKVTANADMSIGSEAFSRTCDRGVAVASRAM